MEETKTTELEKDEETLNMEKSLSEDRSKCEPVNEEDISKGGNE